MSTDVHLHRAGALGYITLQRDGALNSLTPGMIAAISDGLARHTADTAVGAIVIRSALDGVFCAGGDVKLVREMALAGDEAAIARFFENEYRLDLAIADCPKPWLSFIDGIAMGGGLGISVNGRFRIASERAAMAMPETRIGFHPDVGGSHFLPRLPHRAGRWLALAGTTVRGWQCLETGLATHFLPATAWPALWQALESLSPDTLNENTVGQLLMDAGAETRDSNTATPARRTYRDLLQRRAAWFEVLQLDSIRQRLTIAAADDTDAAALLDTLGGVSPAALELTVSLFDEHCERSLAECLRQELAASIAQSSHPDFIEGVRAMLVDKDKRPRWL